MDVITCIIKSRAPDWIIFNEQILGLLVQMKYLESIYNLNDKIITLLPDTTYTLYNS